jgi:SAM-dependent methyltransferase
MCLRRGHGLRHAGRSPLTEQPSAPLTQNYDRGFHRAIVGESARGAHGIWPVVLGAIEAPSSVVDFGCGLGTWLAVLRELVPQCEVMGVDHPGVTQGDLLIPRDRFVPADLQGAIDLKRKFDLCMSIEVGEHLPPDKARQFVESLTRHSDRVLFSAAMPGQGGHLHINEQWPSYWVKLFAEQGYRCFDFVRPRVWTDTSIPIWYRQNIVFFAKPDFQPKAGLQDWGGVDVVHPEQYMSTHVKARTVRNLVRFLTKQPLAD